MDSPHLNSLTVSLFLYDGELYYWVGSDARYDFVTGIDKEDMYYFTPVDGKVGDYFADIIETLSMSLRVEAKAEDSGLSGGPFINNTIEEFS